MASKREEIMDAIVAALAGTTSISTIYRSRTAPVQRDESRVLIVTPARDSASQIVSDKLERRLHVVLSIINRGSVPDDSCDDSITSAYAKLMADVTLGGKCMDIEPDDIVFSLDDGDQSSLVVAMQFRVYYRHHLQHLDS